MLSVIANRRSIRKYKDIPIEKQVIEEILQAGILAPSSKNRQPWRFTVVTGHSKAAMLKAMKNGLEREKHTPLLPGSQRHLAGAEYTLKIMEQAPAVIFVTNALGLDLNCPASAEDRIYEICNAQSIGAAMENMTLAAAEQGLGSLWICDTYFAYEELNRWLDTEGELIAAMTIGYADEAPPKRPRKSLSEITKWLE